ncbi:hypothetical protein NEAUS07_1248 [Nematocida ausubeli]|nr:hypothetical protein NEAUS07_1248 [Nematocida ausubeli]
MTEDYKSFLSGIFVGFLTLLFLQVSAVAFGLKKVLTKKQYPDSYHRDLFNDPPNELISLLSIATKECTDLAWLNITIQRFFYELTKSSTFHEKVKATLIKKMSIAFSTGILKRVRFKDISFGSEAPYIKSIRALSKEEINNLPGNKEVPLNKPASFKQVYLLISMDYTAGDNCIFIDADLIKGYSIPIRVKLQPFKGELLLRMPANNYSTRFEISFIRNPGFNFTVDASFSKNDSAFFSNTLSHLIKKLCEYTAKMYIFPNWYYYYLPIVVYRAKTISYSYYPIKNGSTDGLMQQIREVQNLFSLDFGIVKKWENVIFRKTKSTVNSSNTVLEKAEIELINKPSILVELFSQGSVEIFSDVISDYEGAEVLESFGPGVELVQIVISNQIYEFIRIIIDGLIIYQRTDPEEPQFIAFKREVSGSITLLQYVNVSEAFYLGQFRIKKLAKKLERQEMKVLGSAKLFRFIDFSVKQAKKTKEIFKTKSEEKMDKALDKAKMEISKEEVLQRDSFKEKYVSEGYTPINSAIPSENPSEVSIIESHFIEIQKDLNDSERRPDQVIILPYKKEDLKKVFESSLIRASILGSFTIMEDILLTEKIRNISMAQPSGQYVQLLSYFDEDENLLIERILLSEEHKGVTAAVRVSDERLEIFLFGGRSLYLGNFKQLIIPYLEGSKILNLPKMEIPKKHVETLIDSSGFIISSEVPTVCQVKVEVDNVVFFKVDVNIKNPFIFRFKNKKNLSMIVSVKNKKNTPLEMAIIPISNKIKINPSEKKSKDILTEGFVSSDQTISDMEEVSFSANSTETNESQEEGREENTPEEKANYIQIEGDLVLQKKSKVSILSGRGLLYWNIPWSPAEKVKTEEVDSLLINGSGYALAETPVQMYCKNAENKTVAKSIKVGIIYNPDVTDIQ